MDLSLDNIHLQDPLVLLGSEGSALTISIFLLSSGISMVCHCYSTVRKDHFLVLSMSLNGLCVPLCLKARIHFISEEIYSMHSMYTYREYTSPMSKVGRIN